MISLPSFMRGDATVKYNCHSYAWYSQAINNQYWINNPQKYREGNWFKSTGWTDLIPSGIKAGDVVDYYITETNRPHLLMCDKEVIEV